MTQDYNMSIHTTPPAAQPAPAAAPVQPAPAVQERVVLENEKWYWVRYVGINKAYEAPALYREGSKAFYSLQFSGIPVREIDAFCECTPPQPAQPAQRKPLTIDECLRDFESWLHSQGQHAFLKAPEGSKNTFWDGRTEDRWLGWKAAHGIKEKNNG